MAELLWTTLELAGYRTSVAATGTEALARAAEHRYDLVVLDATLPDVPDLGRERRPPVTRRPPVLFLTAYDSLDSLLPELSLGEKDYVTKLVLDDTLCRARRGTLTLDLTPAEHRLLRYFLVNAHRVLSKEQTPGTLVDLGAGWRGAVCSCLRRFGSTALVDK